MGFPAPPIEIRLHVLFQRTPKVHFAYTQRAPKVRPMSIHLLSIFGCAYFWCALGVLWGCGGATSRVLLAVVLRDSYGGSLGGTLGVPWGYLGGTLGFLVVYLGGPLGIRWGTLGVLWGQFWGS